MSDNKPKQDPLNLDLIQMVQRARMQHDNETLPSDMNAVYWIEAKNEQPNAPKPTSHSGEWRIPTTTEFVDDWWVIIRDATQQGELGYKSKVSTRPAHGQANRDQRVICVRTIDADDTADVERVRQKLVDFGIDVPLHYTRLDD